MQTLSLHDVLQAVSCRLPDVFVSSEAFNRVLLITKNLPALIAPRMFGFELDPGGPPEPVDFALCLTQPGCDILAGLWPEPLEPAFPADPAARRNLAAFCLQWGNPESPLFHRIDNLWLEFRLNGSDAVPALLPFIGLNVNSFEAGEAAGSTTLLTALELLYGRELPHALRDRIVSILSSLPARIRPFQAGISEKNGECLVRLCLAGLTADELQEFPGAVGLEGRYEFDGIPSLTDRICVHLDVAFREGIAAVMPAVGVELRQAKANELRLETQGEWDGVLENLEAKGSCRPANARLLKDFRGSAYEMLFPDLMKFMTFRFLYYLKAVFSPGKPARMKAYFGFVNREIVPPRGRPVNRASVRVPVPSKEAAVRRASTFLLQNQLPHGEFGILISNDGGLENAALDGSPFTTAFVLYCTRNLRGERIDFMRRRAYGFIMRERLPGCLWRYWTRESGKTIAPDLDDTCCVSFILRELFGSTEIERNTGAILGNRDESGRFVTWIKREGEPNDADPAVNANVLLYLGEREETAAAVLFVKESYVRTMGREDRSWYYPNARALDYMVSRAGTHGVDSLRDLFPAMKTAVLDAQLPDGTWSDELSTALALCTLNYLGVRDGRTDKGSRALIGMQESDGSWRRSPFYAGPEPPSPHAVWFGSEELTSAFCVEALGGEESVT